MWDAASAESQSRLPIKATCVSWGVHNARAVFALLCFKRKKKNLELKDVYANERAAGVQEPFAHGALEKGARLAPSSKNIVSGGSTRKK